MPAPPTALALKVIGVRALKLTWTDPALPFDFIRVFRDTVEVAQVAPGIQDHEDRDLDPKTSFSYTLKADDGGVLSTEAGPVVATTLDGDVNIREVEDALVEALTTICGITVILLDQPGPRPDKPYVTLKLTGPTKIGSRDNLTDDFQLQGMRSFNASINVYADVPTGDDVDPLNAFQCAETIQSSFDRPDIIEELGLKEIGISTIGAVQDVGAALDTRHEDRAQLDVAILKASNKDASGVTEEIDTVPLETSGSFS